MAGRRPAPLAELEQARLRGKPRLLLQVVRPFAKPAVSEVGANATEHRLVALAERDEAIGGAVNA